MSLYIGLISGTSMDGVDACLADIDGDGVRLEHSLCFPYNEPVRETLGAVISPASRLDVATMGWLHSATGHVFAQAAQELMRKTGTTPSDIVAIGSHGQTVAHGASDSPPWSLQLGDANVIAQRTQIETVADFRSADLAAGGQGAPLAPVLHRLLFASSQPTVVLNLGGIANITYLPADSEQEILGFDTGPANCLMDHWVSLHKSRPFDAGGTWAGSGQVIPELLESFLSDDYFAMDYPKSTGREYFNARWLNRQVKYNHAAASVQATLLALTSESVASQARSFDDCRRLIYCGGGAHNSVLIADLQSRLPGWTLESSEKHGVPVDGVEALLFAYLAYLRLQDLPGNIPSVTGASKPCFLGAVYKA